MSKDGLEDSKYVPALDAILGVNAELKIQALGKVIVFLTPIVQSMSKRREFYDIAILCDEYVGDPSEVNELSWLVQEGLTRVITQLSKGKYNPNRHPSFKAWAIKVVENHWRSIGRKRRNEIKHRHTQDVDFSDLDEYHLPNNDMANPELALEAKEIRGQITSHVDQCSQSDDELRAYIETCNLMMEEGILPKPRVVAKVLDVSVSEVYKLRRRFQRCLKKFRGKGGCLGDCNED